MSNITKQHVYLVLKFPFGKEMRVESIHASRHAAIIAAQRGHNRDNECTRHVIKQSVQGTELMDVETSIGTKQLAIIF